MKTPAFWYQTPPSWHSKALLPFACLYKAGLALHRTFTTPKEAKIPTICIGNINAGGSGKTPAAIALMQLIKQSKHIKNPAFLSRGYGGSLAGPTEVTTIHDASHVGEEPILLKQYAPAYIAKNRYAGTNYAADKGIDLLILDDGLQNRTLKATLSLLIINGTMGLGNAQLIPAGPLREPLAEALARIDAIIFIGKDEHNIMPSLPADKPLFRAHIETGKLPPKTKKYLAFCGLGYPDKFFRTAREAGLTIEKTIAFPDHHAYSAADITALEQHGLALLTTEKDAIHLQKLTSLPKIHTLPITLKWESPDALLQWLEGKL